MKRTVVFRIQVPPIELESWHHAATDALAFPYEQEGVAGTLFLNLDDQAIQWDVHGGTDSETGEAYVVKEPLTCIRILVRVEGSYEDETPEIETASTLPKPFDFLGERYGEKPADVKFLAIAHKLAVEYVGRLVSYIKSELGQYWVDLGRMPEWEMWPFLRQVKAKWVNDDGSESWVKMDPLQATALEEDEPGLVFYWDARGLQKTHWEDMRHLLNKALQIEVAEKLLLDAKRHLANGDYRMAIVEAISALEAKLVRFVEQRSKQRKISNRTWKKYKVKLGIAGHLKLLLPLVLGKGELDDWVAAARLPQSDRLDGNAIINRCSNLNGIRNRVIHEGYAPSSDIETVEQGIQAVEWLLKFFRAAETGDSQQQD